MDVLLSQGRRKNPKKCRTNFFKIVFCFTVFFAVNIEGPAAAQDTAQAVIEKLEETAKPIFDPETYKPDQPGKQDDFLEKLRREREKFFREDRERKNKILAKIRKEPDPIKTQQRLEDYYREETKRLQKFTQKQQKKINKHNEKERA